MRTFFCLCLLLLSLALPAFADDMKAASTKPLEAPEPFDSPRLGHMHFAPSTHVPEAKRLFLQGLALCYAFNHDEAVKSFQRALDHDPSLAIAHWGIALASGPNVNLPMDKDHEVTALKELRAAQAATANASPLERDLIAALATRYAEPAGDARGARDTAYAEAMRAVLKRHSDDSDVISLTCESLLDLTPWHWFDNDGKPLGPIQEVITNLEHGLKRDSTHTCLNHLYIHAVEESLHPERGLPCAARLARLAPDAGHLVHMPSHLWARVGRYHEAALLNEKAARIDSAYVQKYSVDGVYPLMYMSHNQDFAAIAFYMEGREAGALKWARPLAAKAEAMAAQMPMIDPFAARPLAILAGFHRWDELIAAPAPSAAVPITRAYWHFTRGMALAAKGRTADAQAELDSLSASAAGLAKDAAVGLNSPADIFGLAHSMLAGDLARAREDMTAAERELRDACKRYDALAYDEPEDWVLSPHLDLAGALLAKHDFTGAEGEYRTELRHHPKHGRALFGLAAALAAQGRKSEAAKARAEFTAAWKHADVRLTLADL